MAASIIDFLSKSKQRITAILDRFLTDKRTLLSSIDPMSTEVCEKLLEFSKNGKMIRGGLVALGWLTGEVEEAGSAVWNTGAAMELIQSGLLVHDDIMDRDQTRRGMPSIFNQYVVKAQREGLQDAYHIGEALGICAGDIAFFTAFELLGSLDAEPGIRNRLTAMTAGDLTWVASAQMLDMYWSAQPDARSEDDVYRLYVYKTGRYTFSLPLQLGAVLAGMDEETVTRLGKIGENLGVVFQIRDDQMGLFGSEKVIGKPVGSDVREAKKTIFYSLLDERASESDRQRLSGIFGNANAGEEEIMFVRRLVIDTGIQNEIDSRIERINRETESLIDEMHISSAAGGLLADLIKYNTNRAV